jgi:hypothetical protein
MASKLESEGFFQSQFFSLALNPYVRHSSTLLSESPPLTNLGHTRQI